MCQKFEKETKTRIASKVHDWIELERSDMYLMKFWKRKVKNMRKAWKKYFFHSSKKNVKFHLQNTTKIYRNLSKLVCEWVSECGRWCCYFLHSNCKQHAHSYPHEYPNPHPSTPPTHKAVLYLIGLIKHLIWLINHLIYQYHPDIFLYSKIFD